MIQCSKVIGVMFSKMKNHSLEFVCDAFIELPVLYKGFTSKPDRPSHSVRIVIGLIALFYSC